MTLPPIQPCPSQISEPGLYDIPISRYHGDPRLCTGPSVSSSVLKRALQCPAKAWAEWSLNPDAAKADTDALRYGRLRHAWLEGQEAFGRVAHVLPIGFDGRKTKEQADWHAEAKEAEANGQLLISQSDVADFVAMDKTLFADPLVASVIRRSHAEASFIAKIGDLWVRARPDFFMPVSGGIHAADYKTCQDASPDAFARDCFRFGYHIQAAVLDLVCDAASGRRLAGYSLIAQEKSTPYLHAVYNLTPEQIALGREAATDALGTLAHCLSTGEWPSYESDIDLPTPRWIAAEMNMEEFA